MIYYPPHDIVRTWPYTKVLSISVNDTFCIAVDAVFFGYVFSCSDHGAPGKCTWNPLGCLKCTLGTVSLKHFGWHFKEKLLFVTLCSRRDVSWIFILVLADKFLEKLLFVTLCSHRDVSLHLYSSVGWHFCCCLWSSVVKEMSVCIYILVFTSFSCCEDWFVLFCALETCCLMAFLWPWIYSKDKKNSKLRHLRKETSVCIFLWYCTYNLTCP